MEKENFSDDDLARLTAESPQWASRGSLSIVMYQSLKIYGALGECNVFHVGGTDTT